MLESVATLEQSELDLAEARGQTVTNSRENRGIGGNDEAAPSASGTQGESFPTSYPHEVGERVGPGHVRRHESLSDLPKAA